ncbi:MAG: hypothetical protein JSR46_08280, partial [Verrucomicrobia bacterium]|nr:hypothetical protein [Verrucomicrobiota bacterium]
MKILLFSSIEDAKVHSPEFAPLKSEKQFLKGERIYTEVGKAQKEHGMMWQLMRLLQAGVDAISASFVSQADRPSFLKRANEFFQEAYSGKEEFTLYVRDKAAEAKVQRVVEAAIKAVRENADTYKDLPIEMRDNERVTLAAIESSR